MRKKIKKIKSLSVLFFMCFTQILIAQTSASTSNISTTGITDQFESVNQFSKKTCDANGTSCTSANETAQVGVFWFEDKDPATAFSAEATRLGDGALTYIISQQAASYNAIGFNFGEYCLNGVKEKYTLDFTNDATLNLTVSSPSSNTETFDISLRMKDADGTVLAINKTVLLTDGTVDEDLWYQHVIGYDKNHSASDYRALTPGSTSNFEFDFKDALSINNPDNPSFPDDINLDNNDFDFSQVTEVVIIPVNTEDDGVPTFAPLAYVEQTLIFSGLTIGDPSLGVDFCTLPIFENSTPASVNITTTGFTLNTDIDKAGTIYYVVVADGATAPTAAEVKAGSGGAIKAGDISVNSGDFTNSFSITGLTAGTNYDVYVIAEDDEVTPNLQASPTKIDITTAALITPTITFSDISKTYGDANFKLNATSNSSATISYSVITGGTGSASLSGTNNGTVNIGNAGTVSIKASQVANDTYIAQNKTIVLTITTADLTITAEEKTKVYGADNPELTYDISGFVNGDVESDLDIAVSIARTTGEDVGSYTITPSGAIDANYNISFTTADLTITKASQSITFDEVTHDASDVFELDATATSGLTVTYTSSDTSVATIIENTITVLSPGSTTITANQQGNDNYEAAISVTQELNVTTLGINENELTIKTIAIYPNPAANAIQIDVNTTDVVTVDIYTLTGKLIKKKKEYVSKELLNISNLQNGIYLVKVANEYGSITGKIVKK